MLQRALLLVLFAAAAAACGGGSISGGDDDDAGGRPDSSPPVDADPAICMGFDCSGHGTCFDVGNAPLCQCDGGYVRGDATTCVAAVGPTLGGCPLMPVDFVFNTPIDALPPDPNSGHYMDTIGSHNIHLDLGTTTDQQADDFYGIPYNIVHGGTFTWPAVAYHSADSDLDWDPRDESDCAIGTNHTVDSPCVAGTAPSPLLPIPAGVIVEGGVSTAATDLPYGDHHILLLDADTCHLWETYHSYLNSGVWNIFGSAQWDLTSDALRPADWSSSDAAGFPILPLLLRPDEASTGTIDHALRFTIDSSKIRTSYIWPARHLTGNGTDSTDLPPMGQLFRLKSNYQIPAGANAQSRAILQALKTYGMYIADGGSDMYVTGVAGAWDDATFDTVQNVSTDQFEAVDIRPLMQRPGWSADSGAVP